MQIGITVLMSCAFQEQTKNWFGDFLSNNSKPKRTSFGLFPSSNSCFVLFCFCNKEKKQTHNKTRKVAVGRVLSGWGRRKSAIASSAGSTGLKFCMIIFFFFKLQP